MDRVDQALAGAIEEALIKAVAKFRAEESVQPCLFCLCTTGEALRPYLSITVHDEKWWDYIEGSFCIYADEFFAPLEKLFTIRPSTYGPLGEQEHAIRMGSMLTALKQADAAGIFGEGEERENVLVLLLTLPPDVSDLEHARILNSASALLSRWEAEGYSGE